jgi:DNA-binding NtrC family response regulator
MKETVLIVDDSLPTLHITADLLKEQGLQVIETLSPITAIEIIKTRQIAVVVCDYYMPQMNGNELLSQINELSPSTIKIMMTSTGNISTMLTAVNQGEVFRFIRKPFEDKEMIDAVNQALCKYRELETMRLAKKFIENP